MFRFANIEFLYALIAIPVLVIGYVLITRHKRRQLRAFGDPALVEQLMYQVEAHLSLSPLYI